MIASVPLDAEAGWRALAPGELLHVRADGRSEITRVIDEEPARRLADEHRDNPESAWSGARRSVTIASDLAA